MGVILETNQLCKFYGTGENQVKAVNHVNIQIGQGEFVAIVGKSGMNSVPCQPRPSPVSVLYCVKYQPVPSASPSSCSK